MKNHRMLALALALVTLLSPVPRLTSMAAGDAPEPDGAALVEPASPASVRQAEQEESAKDVGQEEPKGDLTAVQPVEPPEAPPEAAETDIPDESLPPVQPVDPDAPAHPAVQPVVSPPPESGEVPKPQLEEAAARPKDAATTFKVTFRFYAMDGTMQTFDQTVSQGGNATPPSVPPTYSVLGGKTFVFDGWSSTDYQNVQSDLTIEAQYHEATTYAPQIDDYYLVNYTGKPDKVVSLEIPIVMTKADASIAPVFSNTLYDGTRLDRWTTKATPDKFDQAITTAMGIRQLKVSIDTTSISSMPFTSESVTAANSKRVRTYVVQYFNEEPAYYSQYGFVGGSVNRGFANFDLKVKSSAKNGTYTVPLNIAWTDEEGSHQQVFDAYVQISGQKSSGSGGSGGGGGVTPTEKPVPKARLYIDSVRTEPENPKAGDSFDVIMTLVNSSKTLYLQNIQMTFTVNDDVLRPAGEATNVIYIPKIDANAKREQRIPVESMPDIPNKLVKMDVQLDFEDKKLAAESATQTVTIPVLPIQKMKVDAPKLPTGTTYVEQEYEIEIAVANTGKVVLNNLSAKVIGDKDKIMPGQEFFGGNLEGGASKTVSLSPIPLVEGDTPIKVEISYENDMGDVTTETRDITITASKEEDYSYDPNEFINDIPIEPPKVTAMSVLSVLPKELFMAAGALVLLIIVSMAVSARKRRKRSMEDDEMD